MVKWTKPPLGTQLRKGHPLARGIVGAWLFNDGPPTLGVTHDISGFDNHGTLIADTNIIPGKNGPVMNFDGTGDYINCGLGSSLDVGAGDFTFVAYVKIDVKVSDHEIAVKGDNNSFIDLRWDAGFDAFAWSIDDGGFQQIFHQTTPNIGQWYHVVGVRRGNVSEIYVDAIKSDTSGTIGSIVDLSSFNFVIGRIGDSALRFWNGQIDHVYVYNRALNASEINSLYAEPYQMFQKEPWDLWTAAVSVSALLAEEIIAIANHNDGFITILYPYPP